MDPIRPSMIVAALDTLATRADELANVTMPTLITGAPDRSGAMHLVQRALTDAETAADLVVRGELGDEATRAARMSVTMLEHAAIDDIALRSTADGLRRSLHTIRTTPAMRELDARSLIERASAATTRDEWARLAAMHEAGDVSALSKLPATIDGAPSLRDVLAKLASGADGATTSSFSRYRDAASVAAVPEAARRAGLDALLATPLDALDTLDRAAFGRMGTFLDVDPTIPARATLDEITATDTFANVAHRIADGSEPIATGTRVLDEYGFRQLAPDGAAAYVDDLMTRAPGELEPADWTRLATVLERDTGDALAAVPRRISGSMPLAEQAREIAAGKYAPSRHMQVYFDQYAVNRLAPAERTAAADALLSKDTEALSSDEWRLLAGLVESDADETLIPVTRKITGSESLVTQARAIAAGEYRPSRHMQAYFDRYAVDRLAPEARATEADALLTRDPEGLSNTEWRRLGALLDADTDGSLIPVVRKLDGSESLVTQARAIGAGEYRPSAHARAYFDAYAVSRLPGAERAAAAEVLLGKDPDALTTEEWTRLAALVESDADGTLIPVARKIDGSESLLKQARAIAAGEYRPSRYMHVYFDQYAVSRLTPAERAAAADALLTRDPEGLSNAEWRRLGALVDADTDGSLIPVVRKLEGSEPLVTQARAIGAGEYRPTAHARGYFQAYAISRLAPTERAGTADALLLKDPGTLTSDEWTTLAALVDSDPDGALIPVARKIDGSESLTKQARAIAAGEYRPSKYMHVYFDQYAVAQLAPAERTRIADALLSRDPDELSSAEWRQLAALVDSDPDATLIPLQRKVEGSEPLSKQARAIAAGEYRPSRHARVYFDQYAVSRMAPAERRAEAEQLLFRHPDSLTNTEWRRLAALVDADPDSTLINVPRKMDGALPLTQQAREIAAGEYRPSEYMQKYFTEYVRRNDPAYAAKLETAIDQVAHGTATPESRELVAREWDRLEQLVAGRPAAEQAAIAEVMMGLDSIAGSRSVKSTLELLLANMPPVADMPAALVKTRNETVELIERNLSRLNGTTPTGAVRGYSNHPDYAEIGRIRANTSFLQEALRLEQAADGLRPQPGAAATAAAGVAADEVATASGGETLTW